VEQLLAEIERTTRLTDKGLVSISELQQLESRLAIARINLRRAEELLALLANLEVKDPNAGPY
jgi:outer membrane protein TolC